MRTKKTVIAALCFWGNLFLLGCSEVKTTSYIQAVSIPNGIQKSDRIYLTWIPQINDITASNYSSWLSRFDKAIEKSGFLNLNDKLETQYWTELAKKEIIGKGFKVVNNINDATILIFIGFYINKGEVEKYTYHNPIYGITGYSGTTTSGSANQFGDNLYYTENTSSHPIYGITGYNNGIDYRTIFSKIGFSFAYRASSQEKPVRIYRALLGSADECGILPLLIPNFTKSIFSNFPNNENEMIKLPLASKC
ncbi:hypothetical protein [Swingsia samuiensis]|uniref:Lipoprotein n=1 Tax=Swingsia samuiensis TaxID=1293412 RepID=A0A4Y6UJI1_9PROT|nr:hypothetical protein [Swingsia samuiensis]QDH17779.1 hypothetical protein E3D00_09520 [Swingsia samuiensis]